MTTTKSERVPNKMQEIYNTITELTDAFCAEHLDAECAQLCRQMTAALARKRPSPLVSGHIETWAGGIIYAIAQINFLFDKSQPAHITADAIADAHGIAKSTASSKAKQIRDLLNVSLMDPKWSRPSQLDSNPMAWMISVDGFIMDARALPREIQEIAYAKGLIPYIPGERESE